MTDVRPHNMKVSIGGADVSDEIARAEFHQTAAADEFVTFASSRTGGERDWAVQLTLKESTANGTVFALCRDNVGDEITVTLIPHGNSIASTSQPHWTAQAIIAPLDGKTHGGTATRSRNARSQIEAVWPLKATPTKKTS